MNQVTTNENQVTTNKNTPYFFLFSKEYVIGTPKGIPASDRTIDIHFKDLAENYDLQCKLKLASAGFLKLILNSSLAYLIENAATYLAAFSNDPKEREQRRKYLVDNGLVRILVTDSKLLEEVRRIVLG